MRKPNESLDDFVVKAQEIDAEPPHAVSLRFTGEVEVLKPLAVWESPAKREAAADNSATLGLSWFHRSLVAGGAFALGAIVLASAIFIGMYDGNGAVQLAGDSTETTEVAIAADAPDADAKPSTADNSFSLEPSDADSTSSPEIHDPRSVIRNRSVSRFKPRRQPLRHQYVVSDFTPTTLVIFIEKGEIKTRIEPQLKKPLTFSN